MRGRASRTAEVVAFMRASDQRRASERRIVDDPYAHLFLGPWLRGALASLERTGRLGERGEQLFPNLTTYVLTRHRFIDDCLAVALARGRFEQLVLLGAGYDTRAYRFADALDGRPTFEVDHPATGDRKARVVRQRASALPRARITRVPIDFQSQALGDRLLSEGFRRGARTFWVWEGVSPYLTRAAVKATLTTLRELSARGSDLAMDFWFLLDSPAAIATAVRMSSQLLAILGEPVTFGLDPDDAPDFMRRAGFRTVDLALPADLETRYVRDARRVYPADYLLHARTR